MALGTPGHQMRATAAAPALDPPVKVAIDFPATLVRETDEAARELSTSRSQIIRTAVEAFLHSRRRESLERQIAQSFSANVESDHQLMDEFRHADADDF